MHIPAQTQIHFHALNAFTPAELDKLEAYCDALPLQPAGVYMDKPEVTYEEGVRITQFASVLQHPDINWFYQRLADTIRILNGNSFKFDLRGLSEAPQFMVYHATEGGHFNWHFDTGPQPPRKLSVTVQLSDPSQYEGGRLEFSTGSMVVDSPTERGAVICFPSYMMHRVTPVTSGTRKSIVAWVTGPAFR